MKRITKFGAIASIFGLGVTLFSLASVSAENNRNINNHGFIGGNVIQNNGPTENNFFTNSVERTVSKDDNLGPTYLMRNPDYSAYASIHKNESQMARIFDGTEIKIIECDAFAVSNKISIEIEWCQVEISFESGTSKVGWLPAKNIRKI